MSVMVYLRARERRGTLTESEHVLVLTVFGCRATEAAQALSAAISLAQTVVTFALPVDLLRHEKKLESCSPQATPPLLLPPVLILNCCSLASLLPIF